MKSTNFIHKINAAFDTKSAHALAIALVVVAAVVNLYWSVDYSVNYPLNFDDSKISLEDINTYINKESYGFFDYITGKKNDHPQVMQRLASVFSYHLLGSVNFVFIVFLGNLLTVLYLIFLSRFFSFKGLPLLLATIVILTPSVNVFIWPSAVLLTVPVLMFLHLSLYLVSRLESNQDALKFLLPFVLFNFLMVYSFGNGFVGSLIIAAFCVYKSFFNKKQIPVYAVYAITSLIFLVIYLMGKPSTPDNNFWLYFSEKPWRFIRFSFAFNGSLAKYLADYFGNARLMYNSSVAWGLLLMVTGAVVALKNWKNEKIAIAFGLLMFGLLSGYAAAYGRCYGYSLNQPLGPRYEVYCVLNSLFVLGMIWLAKMRYPSVIFGVFLFLLIAMKFPVNMRSLESNSYYTTYLLHHYLFTNKYKPWRSTQSFQKRVETAMQQSEEIGSYAPSRKMIAQSFDFTHTEETKKWRTLNGKVVKQVNHLGDYSFIRFRVGRQKYERSDYTISCGDKYLKIKPIKWRYYKNWAEFYTVVKFDNEVCREEFYVSRIDK